MRKMVRIGMVATAAAAVFFYLAATYALRHPESLLTQCVITSFHLGTDNNALYKVGRSVGRTAFRIAQIETADSDMTTEEEEQLLCVPPEPLPVEEAKEPSVISPEQREFIIRTIKEQLPSHQIISDSNGNSRKLPLPLFNPPPLCMPPEECDEDYPKIMPPCTDDGNGSKNMPRAAELKRDNDSLFEFWQGLFDSTSKDDETMGAPEAQPEKHYFHDEEPPQCLEDPAYQHQYPGCPFTGKCPGMKQSDSPLMIDPVPDIKPKKSKKSLEIERKANSKADPGCQMSNPSKYELPARLRQLLPGDSTEAEEEPSHPEVDTMEFRPSDAHPGEFNPKPM